MSNNKIDKATAAAMVGVHYKTLETWVANNRAGIREETGYNKTAIGGKITFDRFAFEDWAINRLGVEIKPDNVVDGELIETLPAKTTTRKPERTAERQPAPDLHRQPVTVGPAAEIAAEIRKALVLTSKTFLTLSEAAELSGLPKRFLKMHQAQFGVKLRGRTLFIRRKLEQWQNWQFEDYNLNGGKLAAVETAKTVGRKKGSK